MWRRWTRPGPAVILLALVSLAYNWSYLRLGFQTDDVIFLDLVQREPLSYSRWLGMWAAEEVTAITNLWWFDGDSTGVFFRPLPSLFFEGLVALFGERAVPFHLLTILIHGLVAGSLYLLVRRLTGRAELALLAGFFFLSFEDHSMGVAVITMVTDPLGLLFVNLALLAYAVWLAERRILYLLLSLAALIPAFLSKESAVLAPLVMVAMGLLLPSGRDRPLSNPLRRLNPFLRDRLSWAPAVALVVAYLTAYRALGFGGLGSGMYVDPLTHPLRYLGRLVVNLPIMGLATLSPLPPSLTWFSPDLVVPFALAGAVALTLWLVALWPLRNSGLVLWAAVFYLLALLPQLSAGASERGLYFPAAAASVLLAILVDRIDFVSRRLAPVRPAAPSAARFGGWLALVIVLLPGALLSAALPFAYLPSFQKPAEDASTAVAHVVARDPEHLVILNTPGSMYCFYLQPTLERLLGHSLDVRVLSSMNGVMSVETVGESELELHADRAGWLTNPCAALLRSAGPPRVGEVVEEDLFNATVLELSADRKDVTAVRFRMNVPLRDPSLLILAWDGAAFVPFDAAARGPGERVELADTSDVWASMW